MPSIYGLIKKTYRRIVPEPIRAMFLSRRYPFWRLLEPLKHHLGRAGRNDEIYDRLYFENIVEGSAVHSAPIISASIVEIFHPESVIDVGCGTGALLEALTKLGIRCAGLDYADAAIAMARRRGIDVRKMDLEQPVYMDGKWGVAISMEVAEHLPERCADGFVNLLTSVSDRVVITAATPGQEGTDHVNEQPNSYWIGKFAQRGFDFDEALSLRIRAEWAKSGAADFYANNVMIFARGGKD